MSKKTYREHHVCSDLCDKLNKILDAQTKPNKNKLEVFCCHGNKDATIPVILYSSHDPNKPLKRFGNVGEIVDDEYGCFTTKFFRIEKVDSKCCNVTLSLLRPLDEGGFLVKDICDVYSLERTNFFVEIDLDLVDSLQLLSPILVDRPLPVPPPK